MADQQYPGSSPYGWSTSNYPGDGGAIGAPMPEAEPSFPTHFSTTTPPTFGGPAGGDGTEDEFPPRHDTALWKILLAVYVIGILAIAGGLSFFFNKLETKVAASEAVLKEQVVNPSTNDPKSPTFALKENSEIALADVDILSKILSSDADAQYLLARIWTDPAIAPLDGDSDFWDDGGLGIVMVGLESPEAAAGAMDDLRDSTETSDTKTETGIAGSEGFTTSDGGIIVWTRDEVVLIALGSAQGKITNQKLIALAKLQYDHMNKGQEPTTTNLAQ